MELTLQNTHLSPLYQAAFIQLPLSTFGPRSHFISDPSNNMAAESELQPIINNNLQLQSYYHSLESRIGYRLLLGGTRHFGYYEHDTKWPFPLARSLRAMEDRMAESLDLKPEAKVLDAGCGVGHVAIHLAKHHGYRVQGIDIVDHHLKKAKRNISRSGLSEEQVKVRKMDYHHLESLGDESFDGVYTSETFVHATDPHAVLAGFYRVLRPGGRLSLFEYDHEFIEDSPEAMAASMRKINEFSAMPTNALSHPGVFEEMLEDAGFTNVVVRDYSENIKPMTRLFYLIAYVPFLVVSLLRLEKHFINTVAGVESYRGHGRWRYVAISATKPSHPVEVSKNG
ncbi:S-adenosyl-L-methionine-dependent methyltransferase [Phyllosticta capitalensis]|uniref:S-adenosyl-L-methionine-dependent methyltransferase n=1 Tax=Phyllosticta capitalensis TaxID=121624 RepID=UPI003131968F